MADKNHTTICKNCNQQFAGNFCNYCGQTADTHKLSMHYIWHDLQHGLFHFDNGIFYTIKQLLTRPGHTIKEFISGKRVHHFKPLSFVIVLATLYGLLYHYFIGNIFNGQPIHSAPDVTTAYKEVIRWTFDHYAYTALILVLTTTAASYVIFKKQGYNLAEHLVLNTFFIGLVLVITILMFPVLYIQYTSGGVNALKIYAPIFQMVQLVLMYWCYAQFFNKLTGLQSLGFTLLTYLFMSTINTVLGLVTGWIVSVLS